MNEEKQSARDANNLFQTNKQSLIYAVPLSVYRSGTRVRARVCLLNTDVSFRGDKASVRESRYGDVELSTDNWTFDYPSIEEYWKCLVILTPNNDANTRAISNHGYLTVISPFGLNTKPGEDSVFDNSSSPLLGSEVKIPDVINYLVKRHDDMRLLAPVSWQGKLPKSYPRTGWAADIYNENQKEDYGIRVRQQTSDSWQELKLALKKSGDLSGAYSTAKEAIHQMGPIESHGSVVKIVDSEGSTAGAVSESFITFKCKAADFPGLAPDRFKMAGKKFNRLLNDSPSTILRPITTWVKSIGDLEVYSLAGLMALYKVLNVFK